jgi:predicted dithiol-disulfide oxidoreductase (DUF899 family)
VNITFPGESPEYRAARNSLLDEEISLRRAMESVAVARRNLPSGGPIPEDYLFDTIGPNGNPEKIKLSQLFTPEQKSLVVYNFMFPRWSKDSRPGPSKGTTAELKLEDSPCPSCTALLDSLDPTAIHFAPSGLNFVVVGKAPIERIATYARERAGRTSDSSPPPTTTSNATYQAENSEGDQLPLMTVFHRDGDQIRHFWSSELIFAPIDPGQDPRHLGTIDTLWNIFDMTPEGRPAAWDEQIDYDCCHPHNH